MINNKKKIKGTKGKRRIVICLFFSGEVSARSTQKSKKALFCRINEILPSNRDRNDNPNKEYTQT